MDGVPLMTLFFAVENLADQAGLVFTLLLNASADREEQAGYYIELASTIQGLLTEKFPPSEHLEFAVEYAPAQKIGGDLYEILPSMPIGSGLPSRMFGMGQHRF